MRLLAAAVCAATVAAVLATAAPAAAGHPPEGRPCGFDAVQAGAVGGDAWNTVLYGGPVVVPGGEPMTLTCEIHVNGPRHADPAAASVTGPALPGLGVVAPTAVSFHADEIDYVDICTSATAGATTWYWGGAGWSTDSGTTCPPQRWPGTEVRDAVLGALPERVQPYGYYAWCMAYPMWGPRTATTCDSEFVWEDVNAVGQAADVVVCPLLAVVRGVPGVVEVGPEGDVYVFGELFWDCPPYEG